LVKQDNIPPRAPSTGRPARGAPTHAAATATDANITGKAKVSGNAAASAVARATNVCGVLLDLLFSKQLFFRHCATMASPD
jgi:hypothetical protein